MLVASFAVALLVDVLFPILVALYLRRRFGAAWRFFLYGALIFFVFQMITRVPLVQVLTGALGVGAWSREGQILWIAGLSLSAGLFEEVGRLVGYRWLFRPNDRTWENALMYGAGHGGIESILLVGILGVLGSLVTVLTLGNANLDAIGLTPVQVAQIQALLAVPGWLPLLGGFERICTMALHIALSVMVLQVFVRRSLRWLWLAIGLHGLANFVIVMGGQLVGAAAGSTTTGNVFAEILVLGFALLSLWIVNRLRPPSGAAEVAVA
jgi:uncharacterized membrane protein YhfC